jgi:DNA-binding Lrp family transcriptional regulator
MTDIAKLMAVSDGLDEIDRRIIGYLQADGRAPFSTIAEVLNLPDRTVSRRGQELLAQGVIQVTGLIERSSMARKEAMIVRIVCAPGSNTIVATALANLPETIFVYLTTGNNECITEIFGTPTAISDILLKVIPGIPGVSSLTSHICLKYYRTAAQWNPGLLTDEELEKISMDRVPRPIKEIELLPDDQLILETLSKNGRATFDQISRACGLTEATARRKTGQLLESGALSIHAVVDPAAIGFPVESWMWIKCAPADVATIAEKLILDRHVRYLATISGDFQILFEVVMASRNELKTYIENIGLNISGIVLLESYILMEPFKRSGRKVSSVDK